MLFENLRHIHKLVGGLLLHSIMWSQSAQLGCLFQHLRHWHIDRPLLHSFVWRQYYLDDFQNLRQQGRPPSAPRHVRGFAPEAEAASSAIQLHRAKIQGLLSPVDNCELGIASSFRNLVANCVIVHVGILVVQLPRNHCGATNWLCLLCTCR